MVTHDVPPGSIAYGVPARIKATPDPIGDEGEDYSPPNSTPPAGRSEGRAEESEVE